MTYKLSLGSGQTVELTPQVRVEKPGLRAALCRFFGGRLRWGALRERGFEWRNRLVDEHPNCLCAILPQAATEVIEFDWAAMWRRGDLKLGEMPLGAFNRLIYGPDTEVWEKAIEEALGDFADDDPGALDASDGL